MLTGSLPDPGADVCMALRSAKGRRYKLIAVPPLFRPSPSTRHRCLSRCRRGVRTDEARKGYLPNLCTEINLPGAAGEDGRDCGGAVKMLSRSPLSPADRQRVHNLSVG